MVQTNAQTNFTAKDHFVHLEKDQTDIKIDIAVIKRTMATQADIANLKTELKGDIIQMQGSIKVIERDIKWGMWALAAIIGMLVKLVFFANY